MHIDFNQSLIVQKTRAVLMFSICNPIYVCCLKLFIIILLFFMPFNMICISKHKIMLLATLLLQIYPNYVLYGIYKLVIAYILLL